MPIGLALEVNAIIRHQRTVDSDTGRQVTLIPADGREVLSTRALHDQFVWIVLFVAVQLISSPRPIHFQGTDSPWHQS